MKASDYIVEYFIDKGITDVFGYPGGMVTHLMESFSKYQDRISAHVTYNEQGAALAACGYAQACGMPGIAYATSGPGATNMITGICNAYMDSIPTVFITGQVNSFEQKGNLKVRQRGFQETDIVSMVKTCTKYAVQINSVSELKKELDKAFCIATVGRKGPVLLDIAMDVFRSEIDAELDNKSGAGIKVAFEPKELAEIEELVLKAKRPVLVLGNGVSRKENTFEQINSMELPVVTSMLAIDFRSRLKHYYGFIGAYGDRVANFVVAKSDLVIAVGARLDVRQVGGKRGQFAPNSQIIRIDIDPNELEYKVRNDEYDFCVDSEVALQEIGNIVLENKNNRSSWLETCEFIRKKLMLMDDRLPNKVVRKMSSFIPGNAIITTDVGQNQVWVAQSFDVKGTQRVLFSGGHGAMGYSLPAAIGAYLATKRPVYCFSGDGGIQMNIQELQMVAREQLPIKIVIFNNNALGMIRHFQEMYFQNNYYQTVPNGGFTSPNFEKLAYAYGFSYRKILNVDEVQVLSQIDATIPEIIEVELNENTYVFPKLEFGKPNQDQEPLLNRELYEELMRYGEEE